MKESKRVSLYARYSTDMQRTESITAQIRAMEQYCKQQHWSVVAKYIDEAKSATTDRRPQFLQMIEDSSQKQFDIVLVHKLDRFSRNRYDSAFYKRKLKRNGVTLCSVLERIDDSPESIILEAVLEGISEYYSRNLSREVMKGMKENAYQCKHCGGAAPLGYDVDKNGYLVINPREAEAVVLIYQMFIDGYNRKEIADYLNARGYVTKAGKPFGYNSFIAILKNAKYTGEFVFNHIDAKDYDHKRSSTRFKPESEVIRIPNGCPAIIPLEMFQKAQELKQLGKAINGSHKAKHFYLCAGIIRCGVCNRSMTCRERMQPGFFVYACSSHKDVCSNIKEIDQNKLDTYAIKLVEDTLHTIYNGDLTATQKEQLASYLSDFEKLDHTSKKFRAMIQTFLKSVIVHHKRVTFEISI